MQPFVHLHTHSYYSLLDGLSSPEDLLLAAKEMGQTAMGLTDHGALYGLVDFAIAAKKHGVKPLFGVETYVALDGRYTKKPKDWPSHLLLLARDERGYKRLMEMISRAHTEGYYYRPRVDFELLQEYGEGLIGTSACLGGEVLQLLASGRRDDAAAAIQRYQSFFGKEHFYIEIQPRPEIAEARDLYPKLVALAKELQLPLVAANDIHYARGTQREAHDVLLCVQTGKQLADPDRMRLEGNFSVRSGEEMEQLLIENYGVEVATEAMANTVAIAEQCNVEIAMGKAYFPRFETPAGKSSMEHLRDVTYAGVERRYGIPEALIRTRADDRAAETVEGIDPETLTKIDRVLYELDVIERMDFPTYFLVVWDFIRAAREMGVVVGPGRGSGAGSVVNYSLGITDLDPLRYNLLFERFLNPDRISLPDIDVDFADERRGDVLRYVEQKYGAENVAQICTFGKMMARAVLRDVGRVLGMPLPQVDQIAKLIPSKPGTKLKDVLDTEPELKALGQDPEVRRLFDFARQLEGCVRHVSTHASAVVIAPSKLTDFTPVQHATREDGSIITQYSMNPIEAVGLVKMDFLGLRNLSVIERALKLIEKIRGEKVDLKTIGDDDPQALALLSAGHTTGVFQFESPGMRRYLRELKPSSLEDLIALAALYRPGPIQAGYVDQFVNRKLGREAITLQHPLMAQALAPTYGVIVYQEQVMQISKDMAGFTGGQADTLRKGMGKKIPEVMQKMRKDFVEGSVANGVDRPLADKIFTDLELFAGYAFNKSHSACYALIAYETAYLKSHYPREFMAALLSADRDSMDRITVDLKECQELHIPVLPPSVNESFADFTVVEAGIRFGLSAVKNLGEKAVEMIVAARKSGGPFASLENFLARVDADAVNKKSLESLAKAGAFEGLGERKAILTALDHLTSYARDVQGKTAAGQADLFSLLGEQHRTQVPTLHLTTADPASDREKLAWEKEMLGMFVSAHPLTTAAERLAELGYTRAAITPADEGKAKRVVLMFTELKRFTTKNNETMLFGTAEDLTGQMEVVIFPRTYQQVHELVKVDVPFVCEGKVSFRNGRGEVTDEPKLLLDTLKLFDLTTLPTTALAQPKQRYVPRANAPASAPKPAEPVPAAPTPATTAAPMPGTPDPTLPPHEISIPADLPRERLEALKRLFMQHKGRTPCIVAFVQGEQVVKRVKLPFGVTPSATLDVGIGLLTRGAATS